VQESDSALHELASAVDINVGKMKIAILVSLMLSVVMLGAAMHIMSLRRERDALRVRLVVAHRQKGELEAKLAAASTRIEALEKRQAPQVSASSPVIKSEAAKESLPTLAEGSYSRESDAIVYSPDAKVRVNSDVVISSPTGVMVSDKSQKIFAGDLRLASATNSLEATGLVFDNDMRRVLIKDPKPTPAADVPAAAGR
jgi:hypothetical protein